MLSKQQRIGNISIGGNRKVAVQSMLTADTMDTEACVEQCIKLIEAGCELIRITAPSINEARNLMNIRNLLNEKGYFIPLVADIHYTPKAAIVASAFVEKIRINPGNFIGNKNSRISDERNTIKELLQPIIRECRLNNTAIRIGVNHGSLSDRIMQIYGDSAEGMVVSAMEYIEICEQLDFRDLVISLKSSKVKVMVKANRILFKKMRDRGYAYPLHLGVTEAGSGMDGRIKSIIGISTLLMDGIGDTIRVSLTEEPEAEIPVALKCRKYFQRPSSNNASLGIINCNNPRTVRNIGKDKPPVVVADFSGLDSINANDYSSVGYAFDSKNDLRKKEQACDYIYLGDHVTSTKLPQEIDFIANYCPTTDFSENLYPLFLPENFKKALLRKDLNFLKIRINKVDYGFLCQLKELKNLVLVVDSDYTNARQDEKKLLELMAKNDIAFPFIIKRNFHRLVEEDYLLHSSAGFGSLLLDGFGNGIWSSSECVDLKIQNEVNFGILQATGERISKTEYISCPSCGRAKFNVQQTKEKIEALTHQLKGIKIGVMGCIVNGPGEMADADYGYVGSGNGKVTLYRKKQVVKKNIPESIAADVLIELIKNNGDWVEMEL